MKIMRYYEFKIRRLFVAALMYVCLPTAQAEDFGDAFQKNEFEKWVQSEKTKPKKNEKLDDYYKAESAEHQLFYGFNTEFKNNAGLIVPSKLAEARANAEKRLKEWVKEEYLPKDLQTSLKEAACAWKMYILFDDGRLNSLPHDVLLLTYSLGDWQFKWRIESSSALLIMDNPKEAFPTSEKEGMERLRNLIGKYFKFQPAILDSYEVSFEQPWLKAKGIDQWAMVRKKTPVKRFKFSGNRLYLELLPLRSRVTDEMARSSVFWFTDEEKWEKENGFDSIDFYTGKKKAVK